MQKSTFDSEIKLLEEGYDFIIGIDEAGRGPLAGPVVASAALLKDQPSEKVDLSFGWNLIRDSKTLSAQQRERVFDFIYENFFVGIGICDHRTIDRINVLEATYLAAKKAISFLMREISNKIPNYKISDARHIILFDGNKIIPNLSIEQKAVVNGDKIVKSISAASVIAKVTRDRIMLEAHQKYPQYGFDKHKGYGTKLHLDALKKFGPSEIHRRSFVPVKKLL